MKCNQKIRLIGENVILVPYKRSHVPKYHSWMQNEELLELTASEPLTLEKEYEMQRKWAEDEDKCTFIVLSKQCLNEGKDEIDSMVGDVNLFLIRDEDGGKKDVLIAELEIMIAEQAWRRRGLGKEATIMMILYGMDQLKIRKFQVKIGSKNSGSLNLFQNLGFRKIGYSEVFDEVTLVLDCIGDGSNDKEAENCIQLRQKYHFTLEASESDE